MSLSSSSLNSSSFELFDLLLDEEFELLDFELEFDLGVDFGAVVDFDDDLDDFEDDVSSSSSSDRKSVRVGKECRSRWSPYH